MMGIADIMLHALAVSMVCVTLFKASREGYFLYPLAMLIECLTSYLPKPLNLFYKPFFGCLMCMCSVWSTVYYFTIFPESGIKEFALLLLFAGCFNFFLDIIITLIESIILIYKHETFHWTDRAD